MKSLFIALGVLSLFCYTVFAFSGSGPMKRGETEICTVIDTTTDSMWSTTYTECHYAFNPYCEETYSPCNGGMGYGGGGVPTPVGP